jgi:hypothetical protein
MIVDAYRAMDCRSKRKSTPPIAATGFSKGGFVAVYSSMRRFQCVFGPANTEFAA